MVGDSGRCTGKLEEDDYEILSETINLSGGGFFFEQGDCFSKVTQKTKDVVYSALLWPVETSITVRNENEQLNHQQKHAFSQLLGKHKVV